jgi:hypothetical protein
MNLKVPREYEPDRDYGRGNEGWADKFVYPNAWSLSSFKKVAIKDPHQYPITKPTQTPNGLFYIVLFIFILFVCGQFIRSSSSVQ